MTIKLTEHKIPIRDLYEGYQDKDEDGVFGFSGNLNIRPPYQREFVYKDLQRNLVIDSVMNGFPLNVMYWSDNGNGEYEVIDGQQRIISICEYIEGNFIVNVGKNEKFFHSLSPEEKEQIYDYNLLVYFCQGTHTEKMKWFETINIAGEKLTKQEIKNAVYVGPFVTDAKRHFSKRNSAAHGVGGRYLNDSGDKAMIRQGYLETALEWIIDFQEIETIGEYMSAHQRDPDALELWNHFEKVIEWISDNFTTYRKEMRGTPWGALYKQFHKKKLNPVKMEEQIGKLISDPDVTNKKGIWQYVLTKKEKHLNIRVFSPHDRQAKYDEQGGVCANTGKNCPENGKVLPIELMHADHIIPWKKGGKTEIKNCQMLCAYCNGVKGSN